MAEDQSTYRHAGDNPILGDLASLREARPTEVNLTVDVDDGAVVITMTGRRPGDVTVLALSSVAALTAAGALRRAVTSLRRYEPEPRPGSLFSRF